MTTNPLGPLAKRMMHAIATSNPNLNLSIWEVGAVPLEAQPEPFYCLPEHFPQSTVTAFEVDPELCESLNQKAAHGVRYYSTALGRRTEQRPFFETMQPMCSSLYRPDETLLGHYNNLDMVRLKTTSTLDTVSMDQFIATQKAPAPDFIKIDIQGAELEVFQGGSEALKDTLFVVSEVEFIPLYIDQPLFGDICTELTKSDLMFHSFLGLAGRTIHPVIARNNPNLASQQMWSDAVYMTHINKIQALDSEQLLKLAVFALLYNIFDVVAYALQVYDERHKTTLRNVLHG